MVSAMIEGWNIKKKTSNSTWGLEEVSIKTEILELFENNK